MTDGSQELKSMRSGPAVPDDSVIAPWRRLRTLIFLAVLQLHIGPSPFFPQLGDSAELSRWQYYLTFGVLVATVVTFVLHFPLIWRYLVRNFDIIAFILFAIFREVAAGDWVQVLFALNYLEIFAAVTLIVIVDGVALTSSRLYGFSVFLLLANITAFAAPSISFMRGGTLDGAFRGFASHRNTLGIALNLALSVLLSAKRRGVFLRGALLLACLAMLVAAGSVQAVVFSLLAISIVLLYRFERVAHSVKFFGILIFLTICGVLYVMNPSDALGGLFSFFGRDTTFSGRDNLWALAIYMIDGAPFLGYGMNQFNSDTLAPELLVTYQLGVKFGSAHSSYLQPILDFGWIGAILFYIVVARHTFRVLMAVLRPGKRDIVLPVILTFVCIIGGLVEAERLYVPGSGWLIFVIAKLLFDAQTNPIRSENRLPRPPVFVMPFQHTHVPAPMDELGKR